METGYYWVEINPIYEEESSTIAYYEKSTNNWYLHNIEGDQTMSIYKVIKSVFDSENESYKKGWDDATSQAINEINKTTHQNDDSYENNI